MTIRAGALIDMSSELHPFTEASYQAWQVLFINWLKPNSNYNRERKKYIPVLYMFPQPHKLCFN